jgi:L-threonylcarbamoyladenylate synthase
VTPAPHPEVVRVLGEGPSLAVLTRAAGVLRAGGLVIFPTDTLYALGCMATHYGAVRSVIAAKGRAEGQPLPLLACNRAQVDSLVTGFSTEAEVLAARFWPGPLSLVLTARPGLPPEVTGPRGTIAVRVPRLGLARRLCAVAGPLVGTSANRSGHPAPTTCEEAIAGVGAFASLVLDGGPALSIQPSTIVDVVGEARLIRRGAIGWEDVQAALRGASPSADGVNNPG